MITYNHSGYVLLLFCGNVVPLFQWLITQCSVLCDRPVYFPWCMGAISQMVYELKIQILWKFMLLLCGKIMIRSCHNFAHVTTAVLLWHVQNVWHDWIIGIIMKAKIIFPIFQLWTSCKMNPSIFPRVSDLWTKGDEGLDPSSRNVHEMAAQDNANPGDNLRDVMKKS